MQLTTHFLGTLPPEVRMEAEQWRDALAAVSKPVQASLRQVAARFGVSVQTARRKYDVWRKANGDVRVLVNRAKVPAAQSALTPEFLEWFKALAEQNQRATAPAYRRFVKLWREGQMIPGMSVADNAVRHELPEGYSYDNILRRIGDKFSTTAMRRGLGVAVAKYGPQILTTRANLWYGSHLMIDDLWHDNFVVFGRQLVRVLELDALDVFSGCLVNFGCKPRFQREDGTFDNLKEKYARLVVAGVYFNEGYSERGSTILAEHGTAAISERVAKILFDRSGGKIRLRESGITGEEQAVIGWGQGKGNPRFKAALETLRNLKHNELGFLPAQTGKDRDSRPEQTHGQLVEASEELKVLAVLAQKNPQRAAAFKLKVWEYHSQFLPFLMDAYREINERDWHNLEGWHKAGNIRIEYRTTPTAPNWLTDGEFSELPEISQQLLLQAAQTDSRFIRQRKLSPMEVRQRDRGQLTRLPSFVVGEILGDDFARELETRGSYFNSFSDMELAPEPLLFESVITTPEGREEKLADGKYQVFVNPFDLQQLFVHDARGRCLGVARRANRIDRADDEALKREFGRRSHQIAELQKPILARHAQTVRDENSRLRNNAAIIEDVEGITDAKRQARNLRKFEGDASELLGDNRSSTEISQTDGLDAEGLL
jgi:hypothetical protein